MNCRLNEEKVFPSNKVSRILEDHFVEARLHTDQGEHAATNMEREEEMVQTTATPTYVVIEPKSGRPVSEVLGGTVTVNAFADYLLGAVEASKEIVGRLDEEE